MTSGSFRPVEARGGYLVGGITIIDILARTENRWYLVPSILCQFRTQVKIRALMFQLAYRETKG